MAIFKAIQTQAFRDKIAASTLGLAPHYKLVDAVIGSGWTKMEGGKEVPDVTQIPVDAPITSVPNQFKVTTPQFSYANGKSLINIEEAGFAAGESHKYNVIGIRDNTNEIAIILIAQPAYISAERPLSINATFEDRITVVAS